MSKRCRSPSTDTANEESFDNAVSSNIKESILLQYAVTSDEGVCTVDNFFGDVWEKKPRLFRRPKTISNIKTNDEALMTDDIGELLNVNWQEVASILDSSWTMESKTGSEVIFFRQGVQVDKDMYANDAKLAFLDGCSVVMNHADFCSREIASICDDFQLSFPHCFANAYLTPSGAQAVKAHADDRDVFVVQLCGYKQWKVYRDVPIKHPYPHEQVGKKNIPVPKEIFENVVIDETLGPGDILYMPRGFVHEASCSNDSPSFHATVALMTHDWSQASVYTTILSEKLLSIPSHRLSIDRRVGSEHDSGNRQHIVEDQLRKVTEAAQAVSFADVSRYLLKKYKMHNDKTKEIRAKVGRVFAQEKEDGMFKAITWSTQVRASTPKERKEAETRMKVEGNRKTSNAQKGLNVREDFAESLLYIAGKLKENLSLSIRVSDFRELLAEKEFSVYQFVPDDLSLLVFAKCCIELGVFVAC